jgi:hypothetical protein
MPAKSGLSHGFAAFTSIVLGSFISNYLAAHESILTGLTVSVGRAVTGTVGIEASDTLAGLVVVGFWLAFVWGLAYHLARH